MTDLLAGLLTGIALTLLATYVTHRLANKRSRHEQVRSQALQLVYDFIKAVSKLKYLASSTEKVDQQRFHEAAAEMDAAGELIHVFYGTGLVDVGANLSRATMEIRSAYRSGDPNLKHAALTEYKHTMELFVSHAHTAMGVRKVNKGNLRHRVTTFPEMTKSKFHDVREWMRYQFGPM